MKPFTKHSSHAVIWVLLFLSAASFGACDWFSEKSAEETTPVARVYDRYLYQSDLKGVGANAATPEDSIQAVKNYLDSWIRQELVLRYAKENLPEELEEIEKQVEKYRQQLIVYTYERELVEQKLDTVVSPTEIQQYYDKYKDAFTLKTGIFNISYARFRNPPVLRLDSVRRWFKNPTDENTSRLVSFCRQYAVRYIVNDSAWYTAEEIAVFFPTNKVDWSNLAYRNGFAEVQDSTDLVMLKIHAYKFKGADAPLSYVRNDIYNIIINKRKLDYIQRVHSAIYDDALKSRKFEIYE